MSIEEEIEQKMELFDKFRKMSPEELDAYEKRLEAKKDAAEDEAEKYRRCGIENAGYREVIETTQKAFEMLIGKWRATKSGLGNHPTIFYISGITVGKPDGERYDVLDVNGKPVLTPEQWFNSTEIYIAMFRFAPDFDVTPDVFCSTKFGAGTTCEFDNFINALIREVGQEHDWWKMSVAEFKEGLKKDREKYIERVDRNLMRDNIETVKKLYNILGI